MSWDPKAERITARAEAETARAHAEAMRAQTATERDRAMAELSRQGRQDRHRAATERRERRRARRHAVTNAIKDYAIPVVAISAPAVIAWNGQYRFGRDVMHLGVLSPLLPIALEGSVLYAARLTHKAVEAEQPAGRFRVVTWLLAAVASLLNLWHGLTASGGAITPADIQVGVALGLTSLLGIGLLELTIALRRRTISGRSAEQIRRGVIRRLRYPRLSFQATAIAAARGIAAEEAWRQAWIDRYGVGPDTTPAQRRVARAALTHRAKTARTAALSGEQATRHEAPASADERSNERSRPGSSADSMSAHLGTYTAGGIAELEAFLSDQTTGGGTLRQLPPSRPHDPDRERSLPGHDERPVSAHDDEQADPPERSSRPRPRRGVTARNGGRGDRLSAVRRLLDEDPDVSGADIAAVLKIPDSTARRLRNRVLRERGEQ